MLQFFPGSVPEGLQHSYGGEWLGSVVNMLSLALDGQLHSAAAHGT